MQMIIQLSGFKLIRQSYIECLMCPCKKYAEKDEFL